MTEPTLLGTALAYARRGWPVHPLTPRDKTPLTKWKEAATTDEAQIRRWWEKWPDANIGIPTGRPETFDVADFDGTDSLPVYEQFCRDNPGLPQVLTGGGGHHVLCATAGRRTTSKKNGYEWRGADAYIVAPGSMHSSGRRYEWIVRANGQIPTGPTTATVAASRTERSTLAELLVGPPDDPRKGNDWMAQVAGHFAKQTPFRDGYEALVRLANRTLSHPIAENDIAKLIDSIWKTEQTKGGADLEREKKQRRIRRQADRELKAEEAQTGFEAPAATFDGAAELAVVDAPLVWTVEQLLQAEHQATFAAPFKLGKTTVTVNLIRAWCDDEPFLDRFKVNNRGARVGFWNYEMNARQFRDWLRSLGIQHPERFAVLHLRGERVPLLSDVGAEFAVKWLREREVGMWIADPWSGLLRHSLIPENDNDLVGQLTDRIDRICKEAGVGNVLATAHTGRTKQEEDEEHQRGATRADDWPDVRWMLVQEKGKRLFRAFGRDVDLPWSELRFDPVTKRMTLEDLPGGREQARNAGSDVQLAQIAQTLRDWLRKEPGHKMTAGALAEKIGGQKQLVVNARKVAVQKGWTREVSAGLGKPTWVFLVAEEPS